MMRLGLVIAVAASIVTSSLGARGAEPAHPLRQWVKRHPLPGAPGKPPPRMGYETSYGYDPASGLLIRYGGHNQGGGGEQNSEVWTYDLAKDVWALREPDDAPPGVCCAQQNVFDDAAGLFVRFPAFSGSHGWQSSREIYLKDSSVWTYDLSANRWRAMRPCPEVWPRPLRGAAYDPHHQVTVIHGGEGASHSTVVYDLAENAWHELRPRPAPPVHSQPGFTYDAVNRVFVLFGSQFEKDPRTWVYDLRKNAWAVLETATRPPADKSSPVLAADTRNGIVLCSVRDAEEKLQTWVLDVAKRSWERLPVPEEPEASGSRNRVLTYLEDRNLFVLENRTKDQQQILTLRYAEAPAPRPAPPRDVAVTTRTDGATLRWKAPDERGEAWTYTVERARADRPIWQATFEPVARGVRELRYDDAGLKAGEAWFYRVTAAGPDGRTRGESRIVRTRPAVVMDVTVSALGPKRVEVSWEKAAGEDVAGYLVYRAETSVYSNDQLARVKSRYGDAAAGAVGRVRRIGKFEPLTPRPVAGTSFVDETADLEAGQVEVADALLDRSVHKDAFDAGGRPYRWRTYAYRVVAVNRLGVAGGPSPWKLTIPSAVRQVFAKEEGATATRVKWAANPEKGVAGYHVYRHDGRYDKETITRLTAAGGGPTRALELLDEAAGKSTRRYEVTAVDALGQEGEPSQPVWSRREWGRFYVPYVGEWHQ